MYQVLNCLGYEHDLRLVALGGVVCVLASAVAISLFHRARASQGRRACDGWRSMRLAAGCGIWATHFIAMLAYDPGSMAGYNIGITLLSLVLAIVTVAAGLWIALLGGRRLRGRRLAAPSSVSALRPCITPAWRRSKFRRASPGRSITCWLRWCSAVALAPRRLSVAARGEDPAHDRRAQRCC